MTRTLFLLSLVATLVAIAGPAPAQAPTAPASQNPRTAPAQTFLRDMARYMANADPRVRYGVREGLKAMGPQAIPAINEAKAKEQSAHVRAFMNRTITYIKIVDAKAKGKRVAGRFNDIDYVAMTVNLKWEQIDRSLALLVRASKERTELWRTFKDAGGDRRNKEEMAALNEEIAAIGEKVDAEFKQFLSAEQLPRMRRFYLPGAGKKKRSTDLKRKRAATRK